MYARAMTEWQPLSNGDVVAPKDETSSGGTAVVIALALGFGCMFLLAIIGILAAIAIPNFLAMQLRANRAGGPSTLDALRVAEMAYIAEFDDVVEFGPCPPSPPGRELRGWGDRCLEQLESVGHLPSSAVRCSYVVRKVESAGGAGSPDFTMSAFCDVDGDGDEASYSASREMRASMGTPNNVY